VTTGDTGALLLFILVTSTTTSTIRHPGGGIIIDLLIFVPTTAARRRIVLTAVVRIFGHRLTPTAGAFDLLFGVLTALVFIHDTLSSPPGFRLRLGIILVAVILAAGDVLLVLGAFVPRHQFVPFDMIFWHFMHPTGVSSESGSIRICRPSKGNSRCPHSARPSGRSPWTVSTKGPGWPTS
jgi:hypothetical protein